MNIMELKNISMYFNSNTDKNAKVGALVDVNLNIGEGEIVAVVGESGCGKTTLGKVITDIHKPSEGQLLFEGKDVSKLNKKEYDQYRLGVQMVHQDSYAALNSNRTIFQSLSLPLLQHKIAKNKEEAFDILCEYFNEVGLNPPTQFLEKYPHQLSGGQRQRILLARALSVKPKLIVADEPVSMVDVSLRISLLDLMSRMNKKYNISFIYITHDLATARYIAQNGRIVVMYLGKMIEMNTIKNAIENPKHPYFHALLSAVPVADPKMRTNFVNDLPLRSVDMPSAVNPPSGCRFHPRCPHYKEICTTEEPKLVSCGEGVVACHFSNEIKWQVPKGKRKE